MKVKELIELLIKKDPESSIRVGGGFIDYSTTDVEVVERHGDICIEER